MLKLGEERNPENPLDRCCAFCGRHIGQLALFTDETEIEHIIPYSRSFDDSAANKVVAHRSCNREKRNMTPWEAWGHTERWRSEEHTSELQSLMRISYAVFCLKKKNHKQTRNSHSYMQ